MSMTYIDACKARGTAQGSLQRTQHECSRQKVPPVLLERMTVSTQQSRPFC